MKHLYVDEQLMDLYQNTVIAQTLQIFQPGRLGSVVTNYTSQIRVPITRNNERILSFLSNSKTKSDIPFTSLSCRYMENGIPIIQNARVVLMYVDESEYVLNIYSGPWGYFERIDKKKLWDLDFLDINGPWDETERDGYRNTTEGIVQALVDDGQLEESGGAILYQEDIIRCPQIYYHTVARKLFSSFGYEFEGDIFDNPIFNSIVIPLGVVYKDPRFFESKSFWASASGDQEMINPVTQTDVEFTENITQGSANFYDGVSQYIVVNPDTAARFFRIRFVVNITIEVVGGTVDILLTATGYSDQVIGSGVGDGTYSTSGTLSTGHKDGDVVKVVIIAASGTPTVNITNGIFYAIPYTGIDDPDDETYLPTIVPEYVYFEKLFEDILITDFLRDFCVRFGCQITQINNKIVVNTLNKILDIQTGPDWTAKRHKGPNKISYSIQGYGQTNFIKSPNDDEFSPELTDEYGTGQFLVPNENIPIEQTIYNSLFYVASMITTEGVFMYYLNITEVNEVSMLPEFVRYPGNRMFFVRDRYDFEPPVIYDSVEREDYLVGYFFDPDQEYNMGWQFFIDNFQTKFVDRCLRRLRLLERYYNLKELDIFSFNQQVPIWDNNERFLVTKISNYVPGKLTKVELLKIEPNPENFFVQGTENEISGDIEDTMEVIGNTVDEILSLQMELTEDQTGNPTWQTTFDNGSDSAVLVTTGSGGTDTDTLDPHVGSLNVDADVVKTNNDGNGTDGFPTTTGWVEWLRNGTQVNTETFDSSSHSSLQGLNYTYLNVKAWEILKVFVHEDGTSP